MADLMKRLRPSFFLLHAVVIGQWLLVAVAHGQASYELTDEGFVQIQVPEPGTPEAELADARKLIAQDQAKKALKLLDRWIKQHEDHALIAQAKLLRGDAKVALGAYYKALFDYEDVLVFYPATQEFQTALHREYEIAILYTTGVKRRLWGVRWLPAGGEGEELFIRIQERSPGSPIGEKASIALADYYFQQPDMVLAADAYDLFLMNYPDSDLRQWAMLRLIQASLARFKGPQFDATGLIDAAERLHQYRDEFPAGADRIGADALLVRIRESLARRDFVTADWYERTGEGVSAALLYRRIIKEYPDTAAAEDAIDHLEAMDEPIAASR